MVAMLAKTTPITNRVTSMSHGLKTSATRISNVPNHRATTAKLHYSRKSTTTRGHRSGVVTKAADDDTPEPAAAPTPEPPSSPPGKAIAGAGFALGVALFLGGLGGGTVTLASLEKDSIPLDVALGNGKPTVVEFYADWCEVCKESAPNVYEVESKFGRDINFVMLNIDNTKWGGEMDQYGVDGIPHLVFLDEKGKSEGQVVGRFPKTALEQNVQALVDRKGSVPFAKFVESPSTVQAPNIVAGSAVGVDDPMRGTVSNADPRAHG